MKSATGKSSSYWIKDGLNLPSSPKAASIEGERDQNSEEEFENIFKMIGELSAQWRIELQVSNVTGFTVMGKLILPQNRDLVQFLDVLVMLRIVLGVTNEIVSTSEELWLLKNTEKVQRQVFRYLKGEKYWGI